MYCEAIGIDFGTTHACASVCKANNENNSIMPITVPTRDGSSTLSCYITFKDSNAILGEEAKNLLITFPRSTYYDLKHFLGKEYQADDYIHEGLRKYSFKTVPFIKQDQVAPADSNNSKITKRLFTRFEVEYQHKPQQLEVEDLVGMLMQDLKKSAESLVNASVKKAVVSVPVYFDDEQCKAMTTAAERAGLEVLATISEPIAAVKAYGLDTFNAQDMNNERTILVFDIGGARLDVSLLQVSAQSMKVLASKSIEKIGGDDFLHRLVDLVRENFGAKHNLELAGSKLSLRRVVNACEFVKKQLSDQASAEIQLDCIIEDIDFSMKITREEFENVCMDLFFKMLEPVYTVLATAQVPKEKVSNVILAGGCAKIPKIQKILKDVLPAAQFSHSLPADEVIAKGAALYAHELCK